MSGLRITSSDYGLLWVMVVVCAAARLLPLGTLPWLKEAPLGSVKARRGSEVGIDGVREGWTRPAEEEQEGTRMLRGSAAL